MKTKFLSLLFLLSLNMMLSAQQDEHCGTDRMLQELLRSDPGAANRLRATRNEIERYLSFSGSRDSAGADTIITIPVVVHVIHTGQPQDSSLNISDAQILSQIVVLNECFNKMDPGAGLVHTQFKSRVANVKLKFCLAQFDTAGNPVTGITRDSFGSANQSAMENIIKSQTHWDPNKYLNIWTGSIGPTVLGYTNPLSQPLNSNDGIVVDYRYFGRYPQNPFYYLPGTATVNNFALGKTAVHEVGHWLGLYHIFEGGCNDTLTGTCDTLGDHICDTPPQSEPYYGCGGNLNANTCHEAPLDEKDMWENYMDYVNDACLLMFTTQQADVMLAVLHTVRQSIQFSNVIDSCKATNDSVGMGLSELYEEQLNVSLFPNPSEGAINLQYQIAEKGVVDVMNAMGQLIMTKELLPSGSRILALDLSAQAQGLYLLRVQTAHSEKTLKFSLQR